jgi:hypothetical protein
MLHYVFLSFASFENDHFSYEVPDCTSEEGCFKYLVHGRHELITSGIQEQGVKRQMYRSILLVCSCILVHVNCVHTFLPYFLSRYLSQCINYVHPLNIVK